MTEANTDLVAFDRAKAEEFADLMWGVHHGWACFAYGRSPQRTDEGQYTHAHWEQHFYAWPGERDRAFTDVAQQLAAEPRTDVYVGVLLRQTPERRKGNAASYHALFADFDKPELIEAPPVDGAWYAVASGTGYHLYGVLADDPGPELHEEMNRGLRELTGADHKWSDETVLRLPGTNNFKTDPPNRVYLAQSRPGSLPSATVAKAIAAALQASGAGHTPTAAGNYTPVSGELPPSVAEAMARDTGDRSADMYAIVAACHDAYFTKSQMMAVLRQHPGSVEKYERRLGVEAGRVWEKLVDQHQLLRAAGWQRGATFTTPDGADQAVERHLILTSALGITPRNPRWLERNRIPLCALTICVGPEGLGKSTFAVQRAALVTRGELDGFYAHTPKPVILASVEDTRAEVLVPRLMAAGADMSLVHFLDVAGDPYGLPVLPSDVAALEKLATEVGAALIILDPLSALISAKIDTHRDGDVRQALAPLRALAERCSASVLAIMHLNKNASQADILQRISGSRAFSGIARAVLGVVAHPEEDDKRLVFVAKSNLGPKDTMRALSFEIETVSLPPPHPGDERVQTIRLANLAEVDVDVRTVLVEHDEEGKGNAAEDWLVTFLKGGRKSASEVEQAGRKLNYHIRTVRRRAKNLNVVFTNEGFPARTYWSLPVADSAQWGQSGHQSALGLTGVPTVPTGPEDPNSATQSDEPISTEVDEKPTPRPDPYTTDRDDMDLWLAAQPLVCGICQTNENVRRFGPPYWCVRCWPLHDPRNDGPTQTEPTQETP